MKTTIKTTRRQFIGQTSALCAVSMFAAPGLLRAQNLNSKLNVACIGVCAQGNYSVQNVKEENIVALCDVDGARAKKCFESFPEAKKFADFRKMFDDLDGKIDAVTVATPDHTHAAASVAAMNRGIHCYCEKPLAHDAGEVRKMMETAKAKKLQTQMGTQIHAENNYRRVVEIIQAGVIGKITEVSVWVGGKGWGGRPIPPGTFEIPATLDWDLWLGPAAERPYNPCYVPGGWRAYWAFGNGVLGDMACHYMDLPYWALGLRSPKTIEAAGKPADPECCPLDLTVRYEFPKTEKHDAVTLTWYDTSLRPPVLKEKGMRQWGKGVLFTGTEGFLEADYSGYHLYPEEKFRDFKRPEETIPPSPGHHKEWLNAVRNGGTTSCNFDYSGTLTEAVLLGTVAYRTGRKLTWDAAAFQTDVPEANALLHAERRKGWELG
ncbi:MAG: Gfo/Idh/MocA family oxidoreductase [Planctomycetaceae bacterium]|jgi:predicted dehydrogenase|nr:Gfo/Idh/MocA family oxidoreductase [Planctomycetaceae bacterium]